MAVLGILVCVVSLFTLLLAGVNTQEAAPGSYGDRSGKERKGGLAERASWGFWERSGRNKSRLLFSG